MSESERRGLVRSSIAVKLLTGITGLALIVYIALHLTENLVLFLGAEAYNAYAHFLFTIGYGYLVYVAEVGLAAVFLLHVYAGIQVWLDKRRARGGGYEVVGSAGGPSRKTISSRTMIVTGLLLLVFLALHVWMFRLGPAEEQGYVMVGSEGEAMRDLYRLVWEWFQELPVVIGYMAVMLFLGFHLKHGFWSAWQSLGANNERYAPVIYGVGVVFAVVIAVGFLFLPLYMYLFADPPSAAMSAGTVP